MKKPNLLQRYDRKITNQVEKQPVLDSVDTSVGDTVTKTFLGGCSTSLFYGKEHKIGMEITLPTDKYNALIRSGHKFG